MLPPSTCGSMSDMKIIGGGESGSSGHTADDEEASQLGRTIGSKAQSSGSSTGSTTSDNTVVAVKGSAADGADGASATKATCERQRLDDTFDGQQQNALLDADSGVGQPTTIDPQQGQGMSPFEAAAAAAAKAAAAGAPPPALSKLSENTYTYGNDVIGYFYLPAAAVENGNLSSMLTAHDNQGASVRAEASAATADGKAADAARTPNTSTSSSPLNPAAVLGFSPFHVPTPGNSPIPPTTSLGVNGGYAGVVGPGKSWYQPLPAGGCEMLSLSALHAHAAHQAELQRLATQSYCTSHGHEYPYDVVYPHVVGSGGNAKGSCDPVTKEY